MAPEKLLPSAVEIDAQDPCSDHFDWLCRNGGHKSHPEGNSDLLADGMLVSTNRSRTRLNLAFHCVTIDETDQGVIRNSQATLYKIRPSAVLTVSFRGKAVSELARIFEEMLCCFGPRTTLAARRDDRRAELYNTVKTQLEMGTEESGGRG
jgi:hypothetical protein